MNGKTWNINDVVTYLLIGAAVLVVLLALAGGFPARVAAPLLQALLLAAAVLVYGFFLLFCFRSGNFYLPLAFALGLVFTAFYFYLACLFQVLGPPVIILFHLLPLPLAAVVIRKQRSMIWERVSDFFKRSPLEYAIFFIPFIYACLPSSFYDSLVYHLGIPNFYLVHGGFTAAPQFLFANTSVYYEISLIPAVFAGDMVPRLFHFFTGVIFLLAAADFAVEAFGVKKRTVCVLLLVSMPMSMFLLSTVKNDLISAFFIFLGVRFLLEKRFALSALFWGFSVGVKYSNALPLIIFLVIFLIKEKKLPLKKLAIFALVIAAAILPLLIKNHIYIGNPVFPFLGDYFPSGRWDASRHALMQSDVGKLYRSLPELLKLPYTMSFGTSGFGGTVGAQFIIFLPFLPLLRKELKKRWLLFIFSLLTIYISGYFSGSLRFVYIAFVFLTLYLSLIYQSIANGEPDKKFFGGSRGAILQKSPPGRYLLFFIVTLNIVTGLAHQELMFHSNRLLRGGGDIEAYKAFTFPTYPAIAYVNRNAGPDSQVMLVGEARNYYLEVPYRVASGVDYSILKEHLEGTVSGAEFVQRLKGEGIDYIIFNLVEFNRLQKQYRRLSEREWKKFASYLGYLQGKIVFQQQGIFVFNLNKR
jgi:hypothetical protein